MGALRIWIPLALLFVVLSSAARRSGRRSNVRHRGDGKTNDTAAIQAAVDACGRGGGTVQFPRGDYLSGSIRLRSKVRLQLEMGATLLASRNPQDYDSGNRSLLIAEKVEGVSLVGPGTVRGIGEADLGRRADKKDSQMPAFRAGMLRMNDCRDVSVRDLTILYSDTWTLHFRGCENVLVDGVTIRNNYFHTNSDGIDPVSCRNVRIANCHIVAGDDCIVVKTADGKPCENVVVTNCTLETIATAIKLGTESSGDFRNLHFSNCSIRNSTVGIGLFLKDGATMERITFSAIDIENYTPAGATNVEKSMFPIFVDIERRHKDSKIGRIRDLTFTDVQIASGAGSVIQGMPESPIENLTLRNVTVRVTKPVDYAARRKHIGGRRTTSDSRDTLYVRRPAYLLVAHARRMVVDQVQVFLSDEQFERFPRFALEAVAVEDPTVRDVYRLPPRREGGMAEVSILPAVSPAVPAQTK